MTTALARHRLRTALLIWGILLLSGPRSLAQVPQVSGHFSGVPSEPQQQTQGDPRQEWFRIEFDGKVVGYESILSTAERSGSGGNEPVAGSLVRRIRETRLRIRRFGSDLSVSARLETVETGDGILKSWSLRRTAADSSSIERTGIWSSDNTGFEVTERVGGLLHTELLPSTEPPRSAILSAWVATASKGTQKLWSSAVLFPETAAIVDIQIHAAGGQSLKLPSGQTIAITRFDYWPANSPERKSSLYYDENQSLVRMEQPLMGQTLTLERTDAAGALGEITIEALDLQFSSVLPLRRQLINLERSESVRLSITVGAAEQISLPTSDFQKVEQTAANELLVTLTRPSMEERAEWDPLSPSRSTSVDPQYTSPSRWITSDDEGIRRMGVVAAGSSSILPEKCRRLTRYVWKQMRLSPFSTSLQPASTVAKTLRGDCTEHAVLLVALMRSQGIPARVVVGFVHVPDPASFAPHMWTEAFLDGRWVPFDSTRGPVGVGPGYLKVTDSALSNEIGSGTVLFVPLLSFLGRAIVDVVPK